MSVYCYIVIVSIHYGLKKKKFPKHGFSKLIGDTLQIICFANNVSKAWFCKVSVGGWRRDEACRGGS